MDVSKNINVLGIIDYLPECITSKGNTILSSVPVLSEKAAKIFSTIHKNIPDTEEEFLSVKSLDKSIKKITNSVTNLNKLKLNETVFKALSITLILVSLVALTVGIVALFVFVLPPVLLFSIAYLDVIPLVGVFVGALLTLGSFNLVPSAEEKISLLADKAKVNHQKLKNYFTCNYRTLKENLVKNIELKNQHLELILELGEDEKKAIENERANLEEVLAELKSLHKFYASTP
ncbi:MAG: hypothetical protein H0T62_04925 [Parachlamydiaceae bacterium]|nr:hypothetical protein [Parachlamydiaceae bacterium]